MRIDRSRFHALAVALLTGCGGPATAPVTVADEPANTVELTPEVICATTADDGSCRRWDPARPPEDLCVVYLPSGACAQRESRRVAPVDGHYLEPINECVEQHPIIDRCAQTEARYPVTVQSCAEWNDERQECLAWEATDPAPAEERSPF